MGKDMVHGSYSKWCPFGVPCMVLGLFCITAYICVIIAEPSSCDNMFRVRLRDGVFATCLLMSLTWFISRWFARCPLSLSLVLAFQGLVSFSETCKTLLERVILFASRTPFVRDSY